jgi:hypothetical protein
VSEVPFSPLANPLDINIDRRQKVQMWSVSKRKSSIVTAHLTNFADGRATNFPVYEPSKERRAAIEASLIEQPLVDRYDASKDNRAAGAGFYQFSMDEETRRQQMEDLKQARVDTAIARAEVDTALPHSESRDPTSQGLNPTRVTSRAVEKRRQELEERRKMLDAKRRKMLGPAAAAAGGGADDFLASLEKELLSTSTPT